jgi:hypothetical protein
MPDIHIANLGEPEHISRHPDFMAETIGLAGHIPNNGIASSFVLGEPELSPELAENRQREDQRAETSGTWPLKTYVARTIRFGTSGDAEAFQAFGWSTPEALHTWTIGWRSAVVIPTPLAPQGYFLEVDTGCFLYPPRVHFQPLSIWVNNRRVATLNVKAEGIFAVYCPPPCDGENQTILAFEHPHAFRPRDVADTPDDRELAFAFRRISVLTLAGSVSAFQPSGGSHVVMATDDLGRAIDVAEAISGMPIDDLMTGFEMLAGDCWFGLTQRILGLEPLSMLRFAGATAVFAINGLNTAFRNIDANLHAVHAPDGLDEWMIRNGEGLNYHSGKTLDLDPETVIRSEQIKIAFLRRKFLDDLESTNKIFLFHDRFGVTLDEALALYLALRRTGNHRMLWVRPGSASNAGTVEEIAPGLFAGWLDPLGAPIVSDIPVGGWLTVLANTARLAHLRED